MGFRRSVGATVGPRKQPDARSHVARLSARELARNPNGHTASPLAMRALSEDGFIPVETPENAVAAMRDRRRKVRALLSRDENDRYHWAFFVDEG